MDVPEFEQQTIELADGTVIEGVFVSMGNPHFVILLSSADREDRALSSARDISEEGLAGLDFSINGRPWEEIGEEICFHPDFPDQTNVEFVRILGDESEPADMVALRIYERGVGPTASSGTGTSAAATAMIGIYGALSPLDVIAPGGAQTVQWAGQGEKLYLTGPATLIAHGEAL
jgi:diaminopimelate epimerase